MCQISVFRIVGRTITIESAIHIRGKELCNIKIKQRIQLLHRKNIKKNNNFITSKLFRILGASIIFSKAINLKVI